VCYVAFACCDCKTGDARRVDSFKLGVFELRIGSKVSSIVLLSSIAIGSVVDAKSQAVIVSRCWSVPEITAAKVNELSIKLNVESLRCRLQDTTVQSQYDQFTQSTAKPIKSVSKIVKAHFRGNAKLYDNYAISVANKYGGGVAGESCAQVASLIQSGITTGGTVEGLSSVAELANINPTLIGGACPLKPLAPFIAKRVVRRVKHHK